MAVAVEPVVVVVVAAVLSRLGEGNRPQEARYPGSAVVVEGQEPSLCPLRWALQKGAAAVLQLPRGCCPPPQSALLEAGAGAEAVCLRSAAAAEEPLEVEAAEAAEASFPRFKARRDGHSETDISLEFLRSARNNKQPTRLRPCFLQSFCSRLFLPVRFGFMCSAARLIVIAVSVRLALGLALFRWLATNATFAALLSVEFGLWLLPLFFFPL